MKDFLPNVRSGGKVDKHLMTKIKIWVLALPHRLEMVEYFHLDKDMGFGSTPLLRDA